jgi:hypothetical protein
MLWVDAIYINRTDSLERLHQVSILQKIYSTASKVLTRLGPSTVSSKHAMNFLAKVQDIPPLAESARNFLTLMGEETLVAMQDLLRRPLFHRT